MFVEPAIVTAAAGDLEVVGESLRDVAALAQVPTSGVVPAAQDEISNLAANLFSGKGGWFQAVCAQALAVHEQAVATLMGNAGEYTASELGNAAQL